MNSTLSSGNIFPIGFSIPECKIVKSPHIKTKLFADIIPGNKNTYIYNDEESYYNDYQSSIFGKTKCKAGWDCLRHYEILANGAIPFFENLENCPKNTMVHFPKKIILDIMDFFNQNKLTNEMIFYYTNELLAYTREYLTTKKMAAYILKSVNIKPMQILFLSQNIGVDYLRCLTLHGFKELYGDQCHDYPRIPHLYNDYPIEKLSTLYGKAMSCSRLLDNSFRNNAYDDTINEDIVSHKYDCIIYGSIHRGMPFWDIVNKAYKPSEIILMCGEDIHNCELKHYGKTYPLFLREQ